MRARRMSASIAMQRSMLAGLSDAGGMQQCQAAMQAQRGQHAGAAQALARNSKIAAIAPLLSPSLRVRKRGMGMCA